MADREIKVKLTADGKQLSSELDKGAEKTESFGAKVAGLAKQFGGLIGAAALGAFFKSALQEAAAAEVGMARLGQAVANAGGKFADLAPQLEGTIASVQRLTVYTDDDLREALTRMITVSGDVEASQKNLSLVADLAAFKQIELSDAADIVARAMNGNTTALNKMGIAGKDSATVVENLRKTVGGFAEQEGATFSGSLQRISNGWGDFQEAVGLAILAGGEAGGMADGLVGILANLASWIEQNEEGFQLVTGAIGGAIGALVDVGRTVYEVVQPALGPVFKGTLGVLIAALNTASWAVKGLAVGFKLTAGDILQALGTVVEKGGALLKVFGVQVVAEAGTSIRQFGETLRTTAGEDMRQANATYLQGMRDLLRGTKESHGEVERETRAHGARIVVVDEEAAKKRAALAAKSAYERWKHEDEANSLILAAAVKLQTGLAKTGGHWQGIKEAVDRAHDSTLDIVASTGNLEAAVKQAADENERLKNEAKEAKESFAKSVDTTGSIALSLISAASGMGKLSDEAASALTSVVNMGVSLAKFGIGSPEGILSIIGGLAQLIGGWGASAVYRAQQEASLKNTRALEELTRDLSDYNGAASGRTFQGVIGALQEESDYRGGAPFLDPKAIERRLRERGLTLADARRIAERYGIDVDKDQEGWSKLLGVLSTRKFGSGEGNFADELASVTDSFGVLGIDDADDRLALFRKFAERNIPILADALQGDYSSESGRAGMVAKLRDLYTRSINAQIAPGEYKNATPQQFRQLIATLLPLLGDANGLTGAGIAVGTGVGSGPVGSPGTGGTASSIAPAGIGSAALGGGLPRPRFPDAFLTGGEVAAGTTIHGGITIHNHFPHLTESQHLTEKIVASVDEALLRRYDTLRAAGGLLPQGGP